MKIGIIIPVVQTDMARKLISQLANGIRKPDKLVIMDVSKRGLYDHLSNMAKFHESKLDIDYYRYCPDPKLPYYKPVLGTNEAWTDGYKFLSQTIPYWGHVGFLNDDIEINPYFLQSIMLTYKNHPNLALLYPQTVNCPEKVRTAKLSYTKLKPTKSRHGYAWFLPKQIFDQIPPFPPECKIWYGDNWVMTHLHRLAYGMHINLGNYIYHHGQTTSSELKKSMAEHGMNLSKQRREEHKAYLRARRLWRGK
jgi:hypothetical protein